MVLQIHLSYKTLSCHPDVLWYHISDKLNWRYTIHLWTVFSALLSLLKETSSESALYCSYVLLSICKCMGDFASHWDVFSITIMFLITKFYSCFFINSLRSSSRFLLLKLVCTCSFGLFASTLDKYCVLIRHDSTFLRNPWKHRAHISLRGDRQTMFKLIPSRADPSQPRVPQNLVETSMLDEEFEVEHETIPFILSWRAGTHFVLGN